MKLSAEYDSIDEMPDWEEYTYKSAQLVRLNKRAKEKGFAGDFVITASNIMCTFSNLGGDDEKQNYHTTGDIDWGWTSSEGFAGGYSFPKAVIAAIEKCIEEDT